MPPEIQSRSNSGAKIGHVNVYTKKNNINKKITGSYARNPLQDWGRIRPRIHHICWVHTFRNYYSELDNLLEKSNEFINQDIVLCTILQMAFLRNIM